MGGDTRVGAPGLFGRVRTSDGAGVRTGYPGRDREGT